MKENETTIISASNETITGLTFQGSLSARMPHEDGRPYHTFRTATVLVNGSNLSFVRCRFENNAGPGGEVGQAIALYADGENLSFTDCEIFGHQDSLFLAPLPPKEIEKDGFIGPGQFLPRTRRTVRFTRCRIYGGVDFVFGGATAFFDHCDFISNEPGYVFAPSTPEGEKEGFVARNCRFLSEGLPKGSCFLARPWREFAKVTLIDCFMDEHIHPEGFSDWGKEYAHKTMRFVERGSLGPGGDRKSRRFLAEEND